MNVLSEAIDDYLSEALAASEVLDAIDRGKDGSAVIRGRISFPDEVVTYLKRNAGKIADALTDLTANSIQGSLHQFSMKGELIDSMGRILQFTVWTKNSATHKDVASALSRVFGARPTGSTDAGAKVHVRFLMKDLGMNS